MKRILIVGATSTIATACARLWATEGATFFLVARNTEKLMNIASDLTARGATVAHTYLMDANEFPAHTPMLDACLAALGEIDIALIAHGTLSDQKRCEGDVHYAVQEFSNNGLSVIAILTDLAKRMEVQRRGTIAVISSVAGDRGRPSNYLYGSAKAAVSTFCEGLRARLSRCGVHVLTIKPGFVDTPMTEEMKLPTILVASPEKVGRDIVKAIAHKVNTLYTPIFWRGVMFAIKNIPQGIFKKMHL